MKLTLFLLIVATSLMACRSGRQMIEIDPPPEVYEPVVEEPEPVVIEPEVIPVVEERFSFERQQDEITYDVNRYFVVLGSFRMSGNATRFKDMLEREGFTPVILLSETGFNRVSVDSYSREADARQRVLQIRRSYPEYRDAWLLIRRQ